MGRIFMEPHPPHMGCHSSSPVSCMQPQPATPSILINLKATTPLNWLHFELTGSQWALFWSLLALGLTKATNLPLKQEKCVSIDGNLLRDPVSGPTVPENGLLLLRPLLTPEQPLILNQKAKNLDNSSIHKSQAFSPYAPAMFLLFKYSVWCLQKPPKSIRSLEMCGYRWLWATHCGC